MANVDTIATSIPACPMRTSPASNIAECIVLSDSTYSCSRVLDAQDQTFVLPGAGTVGELVKGFKDQYWSHFPPKETESGDRAREYIGQQVQQATVYDEGRHGRRVPVSRQLPCGRFGCPGKLLFERLCDGEGAARWRVTHVRHQCRRADGTHIVPPPGVSWCFHPDEYDRAADLLELTSWTRALLGPCLWRMRPSERARMNEAALAEAKQERRRRERCAGEATAHAWAQRHCVDMTGHAFCIYELREQDGFKDMPVQLVLYVPGKHMPPAYQREFSSAQREAVRCGAMRRVRRGPGKETGSGILMGGKRYNPTDKGAISFCYAATRGTSAKARERRRSLVRVARAVGRQVAHWCPREYRRKRAACCGAPVVLDAERGPFCLFSCAWDYESYTHLDHGDEGATALNYTARDRVTDAPAPRLPTRSLFVLAGVGACVRPQHGDLLLFEPVEVAHGSALLPVEEGRSEGDYAAVWGSASFCKTQDLARSRDWLRGVQEAAHERGAWPASRAAYREAGAAVAEAVGGGSAEEQGP